MSQNIQVDTNQLGVGAREFTELANLCTSIGRDLLSACAQYRGAGGTGDLGEKFDATYTPGEQAAVQFLAALADAFGVDGVRLANAVRIFLETEAETENVTRK